MNMDVPGECARVAPVRVGVVVTQTPDAAESGCVIREDGRTVDYVWGGKEETTSFSFDRAVTLDNLEQVEPEILQPLAELVPRGYKGTLLIGGIHRTDRTGALIDNDIIKKVLKILFGHISKANRATFNAVSFIQFHPDDSALDLLNPERCDLRPSQHPVLGSLVEGASEVAVRGVEEACALYETGRKRLAETDAPPVSSSFMFSVDTEHMLQTDNAEPEFYRGRLQLVGLAGGVSRNNLRGVSPLVKVLDQIQLGTRTSNPLLPFLLTDALTGNSMTCLLYCIPPQGLLDNEAPSALALAQRIQGLVTTATHGRWCPRVTEQELRSQMQRLRKTMMSQEEQGGQNTHRLAELTKILQIVKDQSWEKRLERSERLKNKIMEWQSTKSKRRPSGDHDTDYQETTEPMKYLQDQLRQEMEAHTREGKGSVEKVQERVTRIQQLRESLNEEMRKRAAPIETLYPSHLEYSRVLEQRRQTKEDHEKLIQEELEKMEEELKQGKAEGVQRELLVMGGERRVLALQMEVLRAEALQAQRDLEDQHHLHQQDMQRLREESLKVFRVFHQVSEEQKKSTTDRYQSLLLEAVQDAVYLSAQNQQLQEEIKVHRAALGELKDSLAARSEPKASQEFSSPPQ